ncbi:MAG TPA: hypothetical protein VFG59_19015 [Anaeromyxobacter sp.]|nr:hypothetical protein [Anaeromyxobacter sp.]
MSFLTFFLTAVLLGGPDCEALRRELDSVAARIEQLKARRLAGESVEAELEPLLVRSQELAQVLERAQPEQRAAPEPAEPDSIEDRADELHERATALRAQAAELAQLLQVLRERIADALRSATAARRRPSASSQLPRATPASTAPPNESSAGAVDIIGLVQQRIELEIRLRNLLTEAVQLDAAAGELERRMEDDRGGPTRVRP